MMKNLLVAAFACLCFGCNDNAAKVQAQQSDVDSTKTANNETPDPGKPTLDTVRYNQLLNYMVEE